MIPGLHWRRAGAGFLQGCLWGRLVGGEEGKRYLNFVLGWEGPDAGCLQSGLWERIK